MFGIRRLKKENAECADLITELTIKIMTLEMDKLTLTSIKDELQHANSRLSIALAKHNNKPKKPVKTRVK